MFAIVKQKSCLLFEDRNACSHREFVVLVVSGRSVNIFRKCCPEVKKLGVGAEFCIAVNIANTGGD